MEGEKRKSNEELIKDLTNQIISNSKDAKWAKEMVHELLSLQKQADVEPVELIVPLNDVIKKIDMGNCSIAKTNAGYLWETKGGLHIFIHMRAMAAYQHMSTFFDILDGTYKSNGETGLNKDGQDGLVVGTSWIMNIPLMALSSDLLFIHTATALRDIVLVDGQEYLDIVKATPESIEDIKANVEFENMGRALETLADTPLPPED